MIPTMILFGLIFGRWWRLSLIAAAVGMAGPAGRIRHDGIAVGLLGAVGLAVTNTGIGVLVHQGVLSTFRLLRDRHASGRVS